MNSLNIFSRAEPVKRFSFAKRSNSARRAELLPTEIEDADVVAPASLRSFAAGSKRVQPGTSTARFTSLHLGWRGACWNWSIFEKKACTKDSSRLYRIDFSGQLYATKTAPTAMVSIDCPSKTSPG